MDLYGHNPRGPDGSVGRGPGHVPPPMPRRPSEPAPDPQHRALSGRTKAVSASLARNRHQSQPDTPRELITVISQGAIPTTPDHVFMGQATEIDVADVEGAVPTFTVDPDNVIPTVFIRGVPVAGSVAVAHAVAGRWVAEVGRPPPPIGIPCGVCGGIPTTITLSYTFTTAGGSSCADYSNSIELTYTGAHTPVWAGTMILPACSSCPGCSGNPTAVRNVNLSCIGNFAFDQSLVLAWPDFGDGTCTFGVSGELAIGTFSCDPFFWSSDTGDTDPLRCPLICNNGFGGPCWRLASATLSA